MIVHINGWPGVGKKTIGCLLARSLSARFIHNHLLHDVAIAVTSIAAPERWPVYEKVRAAAYAALSQLPASEIVVMTNALCKNSQREQLAWKHVVSLAIDRKTPLVPIILQADIDEIAKRIQSVERVGTKLSVPEQLKTFTKIDEIQRPDVQETLIIDVTCLSPNEAASQIKGYLDYTQPNLRAATAQHLVLR